VKTGLFKKELSKSLSELKDARETGDYDFFAGTSMKEAQEFLTEA